MAAIAKSTTRNPSLNSLNPPTSCFHSYTAGETISWGDVCYISSSDGKAYKAGGSGASGLQLRPRGVSTGYAVAGQPITLVSGVSFDYGDSLTAGIDVFLSGATAGALADAATGGAAAIGFVMPNTDGGASTASTIFFFDLN